MGNVYFPHLMITPKKQSEISSCSRGCSICRDNLDYPIALNLDIEQKFYYDLTAFFQVNKVYFREVSFLYYGDFFENFNQVKIGIENLYSHKILRQNTEISVWIRAEKKIHGDVIRYIRDWGNRGQLRLKFGISMDGNFIDCKNKIQKFYKTLLILQKFQLNKKTIILLQCNNIEFCTYTLKEKIELHKILQKINREFRFLEINFSDFVVNLKLESTFELDFFSFEAYEECIYMQENLVEYSLNENLKSEDSIFIEHADIFSDSISIHNPYCKKLKSNNFGSIYDPITEINQNIRKFVQAQEKLSTMFQDDTQGLNRCDFCIKNFGSTLEKPS